MTIGPFLISELVRYFWTYEQTRSTQSHNSLEVPIVDLV